MKTQSLYRRWTIGRIASLAFASTLLAGATATAAAGNPDLPQLSNKQKRFLNKDRASKRTHHNQNGKHPPLTTAEFENDAADSEGQIIELWANDGNNSDSDSIIDGNSSKLLMNMTQMKTDSRRQHHEQKNISMELIYQK